MGDTVDDISEKTLAWLLVAALIVSVGGLMINNARLAPSTPLRAFMAPITGRLIDTGAVHLTIVEASEVNFTSRAINWGAGAVDPGKPSCTITSDSLNGSQDNCTQDDFDTVTSGLVLENIGNQNLTLNISCGTNAAGLLGGTNPGYRWNVTESEAGSCDGGLTTTVSGAGTYIDCSTASIQVCNGTSGGFQSADANDQFTFHFQLHIPSDSNTGVLSDTITATVLQDT